MNGHNFKDIHKQYITSSHIRPEVDYLFLKENQQELDEEMFKQWNSVENNALFNTNKNLQILHKSFINENKQVFNWKIIISAAAIFIMALIIGQNISGNKTKWQTSSGELKEIVLPDGTQVTLNASSEISIKEGFGIKHRNLNLTGEAYFKVTKNQELDFVVKAPKFEVLVTGTVFNIMAYKNEPIFETTLLEGSIDIKCHEKELTLRPGEMASITNKGQFSSINQVNASDYILWKESVLYFKDESLDKIFRKLERAYGLTIVVENKEIEQLHFTGKVKNENIEEVFHLISLSNPINYTIKDTVIHIK